MICDHDRLPGLCPECQAASFKPAKPRWGPGDLVRCGDRVCAVRVVSPLSGYSMQKGYHSGHVYHLRDDGRLDGWAEEDLEEPGTPRCGDRVLTSGGSVVEVTAVMTEVGLVAVTYHDPRTGRVTQTRDWKYATFKEPLTQRVVWWRAGDRALVTVPKEIPEKFHGPPGWLTEMRNLDGQVITVRDRGDRGAVEVMGDNQPHLWPESGSAIPTEWLSRVEHGPVPQELFDSVRQQRESWRASFLKLVDDRAADKARFEQEIADLKKNRDAVDVNYRDNRERLERERDEWEAKHASLLADENSARAKLNELVDDRDALTEAIANLRAETKKLEDTNVNAVASVAAARDEGLDWQKKFYEAQDKTLEVVRRVRHCVLCRLRARGFAFRHDLAESFAHGLEAGARFRGRADAVLKKALPIVAMIAGATLALVMTYAEGHVAGHRAGVEATVPSLPVRTGVLYKLTDGSGRVMTGYALLDESGKLRELTYAGDTAPPTTRSRWF